MSLWARWSKESASGNGDVALLYRAACVLHVKGAVSRLSPEFNFVDKLGAFNRKIRLSERSLISRKLGNVLGNEAGSEFG